MVPMGGRESLGVQRRKTSSVALFVCLLMGGRKSLGVQQRMTSGA